MHTGAARTWADCVRGGREEMEEEGPMIRDQAIDRLTLHNIRKHRGQDMGAIKPRRPRTPKMRVRPFGGVEVPKGTRKVWTEGGKHRGRSNITMGRGGGREGISGAKPVHTSIKGEIEIPHKSQTRPIS